MRPLGLGAILDDQLLQRADAAALVVGEKSVSYAELDRCVQAVAAGLRAAGVSSGDQVAIVAPAGVLSVAGVLGGASIGAAAVLPNYRSPVPELRELIEAVGSVRATVAAEPETVAEIGPVGGPVLGPELLERSSLPAIDRTRGEVAVVLFTSGSTGRPKPVPIRTETLLDRLAPYAVPPQRQVRLVCVPIFHVGGLIGLLVSLVGGHVTVIQPRFDAGEWLGLVERHRVQLTFVVPTMLARILDHPNLTATDLSSLTSIAYGAAPMPPDLIERALVAMPHVGFVNTFGQTETLGGFTALDADDHRHPVRRRSVGRPLPGVEIRLVDPATGQPVGAGEVGELLVRSAQNAIASWQHTGDLVYADRDEYLYFAGRIDDVINRGGEKVSPIEVELALAAHPRVADIAVIGINDVEFGQRVAAALVVHEPVSEQELTSWCLTRLARYKVPERFAFVPAIPYSEVGKVDRRAVGRIFTGGQD